MRGCVADVALVHTESELRGVSGVSGIVTSPERGGDCVFSRHAAAHRGAGIGGRLMQTVSPIYSAKHMQFLVWVRIYRGRCEKVKKRFIVVFFKEGSRLSSNRYNRCQSSFLVSRLLRFLVAASPPV